MPQCCPKTYWGMQVPMSEVAVLVIDMLNAYRHPDAEKLAPHVAEIIDPLAELLSKARGRDDVDVIYVNDNYGDFSAQFSDIVQSALDGARPDLVQPIDHRVAPASGGTGFGRGAATAVVGRHRRRRPVAGTPGAGASAGSARARGGSGAGAQRWARARRAHHVHTAR